MTIRSIALVSLSCCAMAALAGDAGAQCSSLTTLVAPNNGLSGNSQVLFDLSISNPGGINIVALDMVPSSGAGTAFTLDVFTCPGSYVGNDLDPSVWTLGGSGSGVSNGSTVTAAVDLSDFTLAPGNYGVALNVTTAGHRYTNGTGSNQVYSNADMTLTAGMSHSSWWGGTTNSPRVWNGTLHYNCMAPAPVVYCTSGTSVNGCSASINATSNPDVSHSTPCQITIANVEGMRTGIIFYGLTSLPQPWCVMGGGTSFLCVKPPTMRTGPQNSGGTAATCNGQLSLDWNAFQLNTPVALGAPWSAGNKAYVQGWYRDPLSCKTTSLSNAVELTYQP